MGHGRQMETLEQWLGWMRNDLSEWRDWGLFVTPSGRGLAFEELVDRVVEERV